MAKPDQCEHPDPGQPDECCTGTASFNVSLRRDGVLKLCAMCVGRPEYKGLRKRFALGRAD